MRGIFFPPSLLQAQQEGAGQQAHGDMVMPTGPGAGFVFVHAHVALAGFARGCNGPPGPCHIGQRLERRLRGGVGQIVARFAAIQVLAVEDPTLRARLARGRSARPLGAEAVGAGALRALRHGHLLPRGGRQSQAALLDRVPLSLPQFGGAGAAPPLIRGVGPGGCLRPYGHLGAHVEDVLQSRRRQTVPAGGHHAEGRIRSHPVGLQMAPGLRPDKGTGD